MMNDFRGDTIQGGPEAFLQSLGIMILYGGCAIFLIVLDKVLFTRLYFAYPVLILLIESFVMLIIMEGLRITKTVKIVAFSRDRWREMLLPSICYCMYSVFSLNAATGLNIPLYGILKHCVPLVNLCLAVSMLKKGQPNIVIVGSMGMITLGAMITSSTANIEFEFDAWAYFYGILSMICQALFLTLVEQMHSSHQKFSAFDMLYLNSFNSIVLFAILDIFDDEIYDAVTAFIASEDALYIAIFMPIVIGFGVALTVYQFLCITVTSALSTSVAWNAKSTIAAFIGYLTGVSYLADGDGKLGAFNVFGMLMNWVGGLLFMHNKWMEKHSAVRTSW